MNASKNGSMGFMFCLCSNAPSHLWILAKFLRIIAIFWGAPVTLGPVRQIQNPMESYALLSFATLCLPIMNLDCLVVNLRLWSMMSLSSTWSFDFI